MELFGVREWHDIWNVYISSKYDGDLVLYYYRVWSEL